MRMEDRSQYREGVVLRDKKRQGEIVDEYDEKGSLVDIGLRNPIRVDRKLQPNIRVTVKIDAKKSRKSKLMGQIVRPAEPRTKLGIYWGYEVRLATSLSEVWTGCPYDPYDTERSSSSSSSSSSSLSSVAAHASGYDYVIGTSENGELAENVKRPSEGTEAGDTKGWLPIRPFKHLMVRFLFSFLFALSFCFLLLFVLFFFFLFLLVISSFFFDFSCVLLCGCVTFSSLNTTYLTDLFFCSSSFLNSLVCRR